ncbi:MULTISPECIES: TonB-dependent siderophore receptor [Mesorhizobium]|uniref:TonB-dependent siderophore receptor n=2 Tax=Mesorhizobium sp. TaxID=1871066 RepID=UPI000493E61D|nr:MULTISPECIES: TonB-dependent siderophore receptor [Mesorhizobium]RWM74177.1 MAG: TonB-dependent siderophore receptor [Mesorhizobium sp.]TIO27312.1 MAG: TonB-dependent siderophore receptor [Mesorhizobium sp.]TJV64380.1 MAG: TonB-dependent siderophore receptor [Mesorhizobium sp.]
MVVGSGRARRNLLIAAMSLPVLLGSGHAVAQEATTTLDPINVQERVESAFGTVDGYVATQGSTATKTDTPLIETPQAISVVTADQIAAQGVESIGNAVRYTAGVAGEMWGNDTRGYGLQIRGFDVWDESFYKDGLRLKGTDFATFLSLDPYGAERIEVLHGPASVLYGQNSPGGIINYVSKRPTDETFREIEVSAGSFDRYQAQFDMGGKIDEAGVLSYRLAGLFRDGEIDVDYVDDDRIFIAPSLKWQPDADTSLTLLATYQRDRTGWGIQFLPAAGTVFPGPGGKRLPNSRFVGEPAFDKFNPTLAMIGYEFEHRFNDTWLVRQNARYSYLDNDEQFGVFGSGFNPDGSYSRYADAGRSSLGNFSVDNQTQATFDTGPLAHTLLMGLDYQYTDYSDWGAEGSVDPLLDIFNPVYGAPVTNLTPYKDDDTQQTQVGLYAQDQIKYENWALTIGGRQDWAKTEILNKLEDSTSEQSDSAFTGRVGLVYLSDIGLAPYLSYSTSFYPTIGTGTNGEAFKPETGEQYEVGVKYQPEGWNSFVTVAAFDLTRENVVRSFGNDRVQTGKIRSRGIEVEGVASLDSGWDIKLAYAYLDMEILDDTEGNGGNMPYGVPHHRLSLWGDYTFHSGKLEGFGFGAGVRYIGSSKGDDENSFEVPAATLVDAALHYDWKNMKFQLNASNLFDKQYVSTCFNREFGCFYGEGRKITGSMKYRW